MHVPVRTVAPASAVASTAEARAACQIDDEVTDHNTLLDRLVSAATAHLDGWRGVLGRCIVTQTWRQDFDAWARVLRLPFPDCTVTELRYFEDGDDTGTVVAATNYDGLADELGAYLRLRDDFDLPGDLAETRAVRVTFTAGFGATAPEDIKHAVLLLVAHWFANREAVNLGNTGTELPLGVAALIAPYRRIGV